MFQDLLNQVPATLAIGILVFFVCCNFFFSLGKMLYQLYIKKNEKENIDDLKDEIKEIVDLVKEANKETMTKVTEIEKAYNDANNQISLIIAHYESEVRFRKLLEDKVNNIEDQLQGVGKPSIETEIQLLKQKMDTISEQLSKIESKNKE